MIESLATEMVVEEEPTIKRESAAADGEGDDGVSEGDEEDALHVLKASHAEARAVVAAARVAVGVEELPVAATVMRNRIHSGR
jgi:hypothetical protein